MPPVSESGKVLAELPVSSWAWEQTPTPVDFTTSLDTLGHAGAPAACIALEGSGRAVPS